MARTTFTGPVKSTNGFISGTGSIVSATAATLAITEALHAGRTILLDRAAGVTCTLPAATGSGNTYMFFVKTTVTSNSDIIKVADSTDVMSGLALSFQDGGNTTVGFETAADTDTITLDGSTTGGIAGGQITLQDVATNLWRVNIVQSATGTEATPFSATV